MSRFHWSDTGEPVLGEPAAAEVSVDLLAEMLGKLPPESNAMSVGEMDGFVTGLVVYPEIIPPSEWLPHVWGPDTEFGSAGQAEAMEWALIDHYSGIACSLAQEPEHYGPVLEVDDHSEEVFWKPWIFGFARAMRLRPGAWERIEGSDELDVIESVQVIQRLYEGSTGTSKLTEEGLELLDSLAPMLIGGMVRDLNARKRSRGVSAVERLVPVASGAAGAKTVPDAPCGCGSGHPYHRCCGVH